MPVPGSCFVGVPNFLPNSPDGVSGTGNNEVVPKLPN